MYLLFDIGGTHMRLAVANNLKRIQKEKIVPTPKDFHVGMRSFEKASRELTQGGRIQAIAGGLPGSFDTRKTMIVHATNLKGWEQKPFTKTLGRLFKAPVYLENDAAFAGLGEAVFGAGKKKKIVAYLTVSTGVGGVKIVNQTIDANAFGFEPTYQIIDQAGNHLGSYISGKAIEKRYHKQAQFLPATIRNSLARSLAVGLNNIIVLWSPEIIILGGPLILGKNPIPLQRAKQELKRVYQAFAKAPEIVTAKLGDQPGLYGAMAYLRSQKRRA
jgi:predicted NBD/HSP70 family sugar kinase